MLNGVIDFKFMGAFCDNLLALWSIVVFEINFFDLILDILWQLQILYRYMSHWPFSLIMQPCSNPRSCKGLHIPWHLNQLDANVDQKT